MARPNWWKVETMFLYIDFIVSFVFTIALIHVLTLIHAGQTKSLKDRLLKMVTSIIRQYLTCFYITLLSLGYIFLCLLTLLPIGLTMGNRVASILLTTLAMVFYIYLLVVWNLSLVVSAREGKYGMEALGKAAQTVKGIKLARFMFIVVVTIISLILIQCSRAVDLKQSEAIVISILGYTAKIVLYFECKKCCGEEVIELQPESMEEYTKIPTVPLSSENIP